MSQENQSQARAPLRPLDPLGEMMVLDTRPGYPMCFFLECRCRGPLDRDRLGRALSGIAPRHPNIHDRLAWRAGRPYWERARLKPVLMWDPQDEEPWKPFDLIAESGLRLVVFPDPVSESLCWRVVLFGHHVVCDGLAACELMGEIWSGYAGRSLPPLQQTERLPEPLPEERDETEEKPVAGRLSAVLAEGLRFFRFFPARLFRRGQTVEITGAGPSHDGAPSTPYHLRRFSEDELERMRQHTRERSITLNDWILAATMRVFVEWNRQNSGSRRGVRVTMPVSLRQTDQRLTAENRIGYAFLDRTRKECEAIDPLVMSLTEATRWIKETGAAGMFVTALDLLRKVPFLLRLVLRLPVCFSTAVVSNLGNALARMNVDVSDYQTGFQADEMVITDLVGVPPVRPRTSVSIGVARCDNRLWLSCLVDESQLGFDAAEELLVAIQRECLCGLGKC